MIVGLVTRILNPTKEHKVTEITKGEVEKAGASYTVKIENGDIVVSAKISLEKLVDLAGVAIPGDSAAEQAVLSVIKTIIKLA